MKNIREHMVKTANKVEGKAHMYEDSVTVCLWKIWPKSASGLISPFLTIRDTYRKNEIKQKHR